MVDYSKWDQLNFSSDEDDCHPNIEINTWRRLKERYRKEHGLTKREPKLIDKWSSTVVNKEQYDLMNVGSKNDKEDENKNEKNNDNVDNKNEQNITADNNNNNNNDNKDNKQETTTNNPNEENLPTNENNAKPNTSKNDTHSQPTKTTTSTSTSSAPTSSSSAPTSTSTSSSSAQKTNQSQKDKKNDDEHYYARSDPSTFLKEHMNEVKHFASIKNHKTADKYLVDHYELIHEATEGYLITHAVDRAVEGCDEKEKERLAYRCLQIHNLVQSCSTANVGPQKGVEVFYSRLSVPQIQQQYAIELNKQVGELLQRIEQRRKERLSEMMANEVEEEEEERAPLGPGGLDPSEVLNSLPESMKECFISRDVGKLREVLSNMPSDEASYHFQRCIDAGLWVENINDDDNDDNNDNNVDNNDNNDDGHEKNENQDDKQSNTNNTNDKDSK